jgi:hypothetical protein
MSTPLQPFSSPLALLDGFNISTPLVAEILLTIVILFWALYTIVAIYHWLRYSHGAVIAVPAIIVHLIVSGIFIAVALSGLATI